MNAESCSFRSKAIDGISVCLLRIYPTRKDNNINKEVTGEHECKAYDGHCLLQHHIINNITLLYSITASSA
jgi:hypothetical protein